MCGGSARITEEASMVDPGFIFYQQQIAAMAAQAQARAQADTEAGLLLLQQQSSMTIPPSDEES
ncbi:hypothetical protein GCM10027259_52070 [Micromonospora palomenae]